MIRAAAPTDTPAILDLALAARLFQSHEVESLREALDGFHAGRSGPGHRLEVWIDDRGGPPVGVVYFGPNPMSDRAWDLLMIAVAPQRQGQGIGSKLVQFAEALIGATGGRLLIVESSSQPTFDAARAFYTRHGYTEVARVPDFYADGDSKVIFTKRIVQV